MKIYLIRHGEYEADPDKAKYFLDHETGEPDGKLSILGRTHASNLAELFISKNIKIDKLYASKFERAIESAKAFGKTYGIEEVVISHMLVEANFDREEIIDVEERMNRFIKEIKTSYKNETIAAFSHSSAIRTLMDTIHKDKNREGLDYTGYTLIDYSLDKPNILEYNNCPHYNTLKNK